MPISQTITLPAKTPVTLPSGTVIETGGLTGTASQSTLSRTGLRAASDAGEDDIHPQLRAALAELEIDEQETILLDAVLPPTGRGLRAAGGSDQIVLEPAVASRPEAMRLVLYQDESGGVSWHLPDDWAGASQARGPRLRARRAAGGGARFTIAARTVEARTPRSQGAGRRLRGKITSIGRKVLKVFVLPVLSPLLAKPLEAIVGAVERRHRQDLIRTLTPDNYLRRVSEPFAGWQQVDEQHRALLVVHGIFSSTEGVLSQLPLAAMQELSAHYGGRVLAFDQLTVSRSPEENARFFLEEARLAAPGRTLAFDVLCHSRGGIVSRALAERGQVLVPGHNCRFRKVFFVATPNRGSVLANPDHIVDMIDTFTNIATSFPDGPVMYSIEVLLAILKLIAHASATELPGLSSMGTAGYIAELNRSTVPSPAGYAAAAANYTPDPKGDNGFLLGHFANAAVDRIFKDGSKDVPNDLVVPFEGVAGPNGHPSFPIANPLLFGESERVWHSGFFERGETLDAIKRHFELPGAGAVPVLESAPAAPDVDLPIAAPDPIEFESSTASDPSAPDAPSEATSFGQEDPPPPPPPSPVIPRRRPRMRGGAGMAAPTPATPTPAPTKAGVQLERDPQLDFHEQVQEGEPNVLTVRLEDLASGADRSQALTVALAAGQSQTEIGVTLAAPGFDVETLGEARMIVKTVRDAALEKVEFRLTARNPGANAVRREISASFWLGNSCIGAVGHRTVVVPKGAVGFSDGSKFGSGFLLPPTPRAGCDLAIGVQGDDEAGLPPFRVSLRSEIPGQEYSDLYVGKLRLDQPGATLATHLDQFYKRHFDNYPGDNLSDAAFDMAHAKWTQQFNAGLISLGKQLWSFLPERLRDEYFRLHRAGAQLRSILVHSDEMILPWELIVPYQTVDGKLVELPPLGQRHVLGRWKPGLRMKPQPQQLRVQKFYVLNPRYTGPDALPSAEQEATTLHALFPKSTILAPANWATVSQVLTQSDVHLLHFSGHGDTQANPDFNKLLLEDGDELDAQSMFGTKLAVEGSPVVYLNACHAGNTGNVVGRAGGFSANLLQSGCSGVIAPYWPVDDDRAAEFSLALYQRLAQGEAIGVVLRDLRAAHADDPTYMAFSYFGDPWARLDLDGLKS